MVKLFFYVAIASENPTLSPLQSIQAISNDSHAIANLIVRDYQRWRYAECRIAIEEPIAHNTLLGKHFHHSEHTLRATQLDSQKQTAAANLLYGRMVSQELLIQRSFTSVRRCRQRFPQSAWQNTAPAGMPAPETGCTSPSPAKSPSAAIRPAPAPDPPGGRPFLFAALPVCFSWCSPFLKVKLALHSQYKTSPQKCQAHFTFLQAVFYGSI